MLGQLERYFGRERLTPRVNRADGVEQLLVQGVLQQVTVRAGLQRTQGLRVARVSGKYDDARVGKFAADRIDRVEPTHLWHLQVHAGQDEAEGSPLRDSRAHD